MRVVLLPDVAVGGGEGDLTLSSVAEAQKKIKLAGGESAARAGLLGGMEALKKLQETNMHAYNRLIKPDGKGNRYCINLVSVAGRPAGGGKEEL